MFRILLPLLVAGVPAILIALRPLPPPAECPRWEEPKYLGSKSCQKCHFKEYQTWQKTDMAKAFSTLKPGEAVEAKKKASLDPAKDYTKEAACVKCHTTGYGKPGGYPEIVAGREWSAEEMSRAPLMEGVGCESCHGPGEEYSPYKKEHKDYKWADIAKLGAIHPTDATCTACHNRESPTYVEFKFAEKIGKDTHEILKLKTDHGCDHPHREGK
ncbi:MAG: cytochrome c family protein [Planctomycetes bacterium]|nr:cytochrome c family protein [Planctomycetota bacterium]